MALPEETKASETALELSQDVGNILNEKKRKNVDGTEELAKRTKPSQSKKKPTIPRGQPKSNRPWKEVKLKFSNVKKSIHRATKDKKDEFRNDMKHIKELSRSIKEQRKMDNEQKRLRREENARIKLENERKAEIVQVIKNPAKLKRMKKKALRMIEKRDLSKIKVV